MKSMTLRIPSEQAEALQFVAAVDGESMSEVIRAAIDDYIVRRRADDQFMAGVRDQLARTERFLESGAK